ncbi:MAG: glycosyltransferase family 9 protein [Blastocatellia bacterium]
MMNDAGQHTNPQQLVSEFLASSGYLRENISRLAELAVSQTAEVAELATGALFTSLVERLADSFDAGAVSIYNRVFAQVIQRCRATERGRAIDRALAGFNLESEEDLIARAESLRHTKARDLESGVRRVIVLSRVTLGADVAITSVIIERMKREFPDAEIVLVGGRKATELFGGDSRLSFKEIAYRRAGTTIERLLSWLDLLDVVRGLTKGLERGEFLIVDPDTRLTQLGLLPLARDEGDYLFFPSREYGNSTSESLGLLTSRWLDTIFGAPYMIYPRLSLARSDLEAAGSLVKQLSRPVVAINFGVGENPMKRVGDEFESSLVGQLVGKGVTVILDRGAGEDETRRADAVIRHAIESSRARVAEVDEERLLSGDAARGEIIVWSGRIGLLAALISKSDLYIGYDSAGQHIAAALGIPLIDVFAGFISPRMPDRWRPTGASETRVVVVDKTETDRVLREVLAHAQELLKGGKQ